MLRSVASQPAIKLRAYTHPVIYWNWKERKEKQPDGSTRKQRTGFVRYYTIFNLSQIEGIDDPDVDEDLDVIEFSPIAKCEAITRNMPQRPKIDHREQRAYYRPSTDVINLPTPASFESVEAYYSTLFHEIVHSSGHVTRLDRKGISDDVLFGGHEYSKEELVAEMGSAFLCGEAAIDAATLDDQAAYIGGWLAKLKNDSRLVISAAAQAQKAADFILDRNFEVSLVN